MALPEPRDFQDEDEAPDTPFTETAMEVGKREAEMGREPNPVRRFLKVLGPGLVTGASDDDPAGIGTYVVAGASFGRLLSTGPSRPPCSR